MSAMDANARLAHLGDIEVEAVVELGRKQLKLSAVRQLRPHAILALEKLAGEPFDLRINDASFAACEVVVVGDSMAVRITRLQQAPRDVQRREEAAEAAVEIQLLMAEDDPRQKMNYIPAGSFPMGSRDEAGPSNERPWHPVHLAAFFIDPFPVTNLHYLEFVRQSAHGPPPHWSGDTFPTGLDNHPVTNVSWQDAQVYASWSGARLPTEAEWEKAARGTDALTYPWGDRFVEGEQCNSGNMVGTTTPVDEFPAGRSPYGVWDMAGNVYEWCSDYYDEAYYQNSPATNPQGPEDGRERVLRGGSFQQTRAALHCSHRSGTVETCGREDIGFRCVMDA